MANFSRRKTSRPESTVLSKDAQSKAIKPRRVGAFIKSVGKQKVPINIQAKDIQSPYLYEYNQSYINKGGVGFSTGSTPVDPTLPIQIEGCVCWIDPADSDTVNRARAIDKSGLGNSLFQSNSDLRLDLKDGYYYGQEDGDQWMAWESEITDIKAGFMVYEYNGEGSPSVFDDEIGNAVTNADITVGPPSEQEMVICGPSACIGTSVEAPLGLVVASFVFTGTTAEVFINGISAGTGDPGVISARIFGNYSNGDGTGREGDAFDGRIGDLLFYDRELDSEEIDSITEFLKTKHNI